MSFTLTAPRFDWYAATVTDRDFSEHSTTKIRDEPVRLVVGRHGFAHGYEIRREGRKVCTIYAGGGHEYPHVVASGQDADEVARWLRHSRRSGAGYAHVVSRADVCTDTADQHAFGRLVALAEGLPGAGDNLQTGRHGKTKAGVTAETFYVGSRSSEAYGRIYEKSKQSPGEYPDGTVRVEIEVKPKKPFRREWAAKATPAELFGYSIWSRRLASMIGLEQAQAPPARSARVTDLDGAVAAMCDQYGARLLELFEHHGGDLQAFGLDLLAHAERSRQLPATAVDES